MDSLDQSNGKIGDQKVIVLLFLTCYVVSYNVLISDNILFILPLVQALRRLAQNREAARKSRMRKKVKSNILNALLIDSI